MILTIQMAWPWRCCYSHRDVVSLGISRLLSLISAWTLTGPLPVKAALSVTNQSSSWRGGSDH